MLNTIIYPALYINTIDFNRGTCAYIDADNISSRHTTDIAAYMAHEISILLAEKRPNTIIFAIGNGGSFTGARLGWCIVRTLAIVYKCDIWSVNKEIELTDVCNMVELFNFNGPQY